MPCPRLGRTFFAGKAAKCLVLCFVASVALAQIADGQPSLKGFDSLAQQVLKDWKCAGFAVVVIKDRKVTYAKGFGARDLKNNQPVTPKTLFAIGNGSMVEFKGTIWSSTKGEAYQWRRSKSEL